MKKKEIQDINRLLDAMESLDNFDSDELNDVITGEVTKELYSLLSDLETINPKVNKSAPDVEREWSNFARWMRMQRRVGRKRRLSKSGNNTVFIITSVVILFCVFMILLLIFL